MSVMNSTTFTAYKNAAAQARGLAIDAIADRKSGHLGLPLGCAEIGAVLFGQVLRYDPKHPEWLNRDRFILSAGHGSMFLYSWLHICGYDISITDVANFRVMGSKTPGHPEFGETPGVEITSGPLGQGIANAGVAAGTGLVMTGVIPSANVTVAGTTGLDKGLTTAAASGNKVSVSLIAAAAMQLAMAIVTKNNSPNKDSVEACLKAQDELYTEQANLAEQVLTMEEMQEEMELLQEQALEVNEAGQSDIVDMEGLYNYYYTKYISISQYVYNIFTKKSYKIYFLRRFLLILC